MLECVRKGSPREWLRVSARSMTGHIGIVGVMARKDISMTPDEMHEFLSSGRKTLQVATIGKAGVPHVAPMWFVLDDGKIVFRSFTKSQKIVNLHRDPRLTVLVETGDTYETLRGVMITGSAAVP